MQRNCPDALHRQQRQGLPHMRKHAAQLPRVHPTQRAATPGGRRHILLSRSLRSCAAIRLAELALGDLAPRTPHTPVRDCTVPVTALVSKLTNSWVSQHYQVQCSA